MKNGRSYRIKFKDRVARYEALAESGTWVRLGSANIADLRAYVDLDGTISKCLVSRGNIMNSLLKTLMIRDNLTEKEAQNQIDEARNQLNIYIENGYLVNAEEICYEFFGLGT